MTNTNVTVRARAKMRTNTGYSRIGLGDGGCLNDAGMHCCKISPLVALLLKPSRQSLEYNKVFTHHISSTSLGSRTRHDTPISSQRCALTLSP